MGFAQTANREEKQQQPKVHNKMNALTFYNCNQRIEYIAVIIQLALHFLVVVNTITLYYAHANLFLFPFECHHSFCRTWPLHFL